VSCASISLIADINSIRFPDDAAPSSLDPSESVGQEITMATHTIFAPDLVPNRGSFSLRRVWTLAGAMLQARQTRRLLAEMDDRLLADIGLSRTNAAVEANRPFWDIR
jgi:uncharacterized protein YjiS (DUF1127 family)